MPDTVINELLIFFWSIVAGALISFIFDVFRIKRRTIKTGKFITVIEDLVYWLIVSLVMFSVIYLTNDGLIRGYTFIGTFLGVIFYMVGLSPAVIKSSMFVIGLIKFLIGKVIWIISIPIKFLIKVFKPIFAFLNKSAKLAGNKANQSRKQYGLAVRSQVRKGTLKLRKTMFKKKS